MDKKETYYENLIAKYFSGEANKDEISDLKEWVSADKLNKKLFEEYSKTWELSEQAMLNSSIDTNNEWDRFSKNISFDEEDKKLIGISRKSFFLRVAAVLIILLIPALFLLLDINGPSDESIIAENNIIESVLPDGTEITLNKGATLEYPSAFKGNEREVKLEGEAFFDVAHDSEKAFIISSGNLRIEVLGTSFYMHSENGKAEVILTSGKLAVYYSGSPAQKTILLPGEKASNINSGGDILKNINTDRNFLSWKTKRFEFTDTPLKEIIEQLGKVYHKEIVVLNPEILDCRITATFNKQSLEAVLRVISSTIDINVKPNGPVIEISGNGCR